MHRPGRTKGGPSGAASPRLESRSSAKPLRTGSRAISRELVIYIVSDYSGTYHLVVDRLRGQWGAELIELDPDRRLDRTISKLGIVRQMLTLRLLRLRHRWTDADTVLVMSWYLIPVVLLVRLRVLCRPRRLVSMGVFV